jgi:hypothetical protein
LEFKTTSYRSGFIGLGFAVGLTAVVIGLGALIVTLGEISMHQPLPLLILGLGVALLLLLVVLALVLYWTIAALRLRYRVDRNGLVIWWGASKLMVPIERIQAVMPGHEIDAHRNEALEWTAFRGIRWAGLRAGHGRLSDDTLARVFSTSPLAHNTFVLTSDHAYIVSPRDPDAFIEAWRVRRGLGPTQHWREEEQRARLFDLPIWRDRVAWALIGLSLLTNLALHIYLSFVFDRLPAILSFHFDLMGRVDRIASRTEILRLPQVALLMLLLDLGAGFVIYRRERIAAHLIWGGGLVLQLLVWGAVFTIIG